MIETFTKEQLVARRNGCGGSEIAAILGEHPYMGALDVYLSKVEDFRRPMTADMCRGVFLEDGIARWYAHNEGVELRPAETMWHAGQAHVMATPDRFVDHADATTSILSIKAPRREGDAWGPIGSTKVPVYAVLQVQWEDAVARSCGYSLAPTHTIAALLDGDLRTYPVPRDENLQDWLLEFAAKWWRDHVVAKKMPDLDGSDGAKAWLRRKFPASKAPMLAATLEDESKLYDLKACEAMCEAADAKYETARQVIEHRIGDAAGIDGNVGKVTWKSNVKGSRVFLSRWKEEN